MSIDFDSFTDGYIGCALWTDAFPLTAEDDPDGFETGGMEHLIVPDDVRATIIERGMLRDFIEDNADDLREYVRLHNERTGLGDWMEADASEHAGHDFWLTRSGHGAGFFDRGMGEVGDRLTAACKPYGSPDDHTPFDRGDGTAGV